MTLSTPTAVSVNSTEAAELDLESSASSNESSSDEDTIWSDQDMDVSEIPIADYSLLAIQADGSQALVPVRSGMASGTVSVYRNVNRVTNVSHPHFRVLPALSAQSGVVATGSSSSQFSYPRAITAGNEVAKFSSQVSVESNASDGALSVAAIQYDETAGEQLQERVYIHESIISMLLRLHSKFSGSADSYRFQDADGKPQEEEGQASTSTTPVKVVESRIGDGSFWIAKVLDKLSRLHPRVRQSIRSTRMALWPPRATDDLPEETCDELQEHEKKRRIKERQQKLLQEFANKQKQFMQQQQAAAEDMDTDQDGSTSAEAASSDTLVAEEAVPEQYDCVICNQSSASTSSRPMCLVVLLQATSVLAHKRHNTGCGLALPVNDEERVLLNKVDTLSVEMERRIDNLRQHMDENSWLSSLNIGYEGGVYAHTCGHYLHLDCHKQYLQSLRSQQRQQSLNVERGEYSCPLCRQLANSALPIATQLTAKKIGASHGTGTLVAHQGSSATKEIFTMFSDEPPLSLHAGSNLMAAMGRVMEDITNATYPRFRQVTATPSPASLFLFVQSVARTNLEIELLQRGDSITRGSVASQPTSDSSPTPGTSSANWNSPGLELRFSSSPVLNCSAGSAAGATSAQSSSLLPWSLLPKRSCSLPLLHVLATHSKILTGRLYAQIWSQISGLAQEQEQQYGAGASCSSVSRCEKQVPLLVQDISSLLLQMILVLPLPFDRRHLTCLVQRLFNVVIVQIASQLTCQMADKKRRMYKMLAVSEWNLAALVSHIVACLEDTHLYMEDEEDSVRESKTVNVEADVHQPLYRMALHFLRLASLLQHHLFGDALPANAVSNTDHEEFTELCSFLNISYEPKFDANFDARAVIRSWCEEFRTFLARSPPVARNLLLQHRSWKSPRLLVLPHSYDTLFQVGIFLGFRQFPSSMLSLITDFSFS